MYILNKDNQCDKKFDYFNYYANSKLFTKWDIVIVLLVIVALVFSIIFILNKETGEYVEIYYKGQLLERHSLNQNIIVTINKKGYNQIIIEENKVYMKSSSCKNQICVHSPSISKVGQRIICAPNGIVVIIAGVKQLDGVTGG